MTTLTFAPRILFFSADPAQVRAQLAGRVVHAASGAAPLRDDVSTDEISPLPAMVHFDATLGRYPYTGFKAGGELPIGRDAMRNADIEVVVAGRRYGKGSLARAQRGGRAVGRRAAGDRRELRAHLPAERRQRGPADQHRLRPGRTHRSAARRSSSTSCSQAATRWPRRSCAPAGCSPTASSGCSMPARRAAAADAAPGPRTLFEKIVERHALATADTPARLAPAKAASCAPTCVSSTSTTPACARTCCSALRRRARRCTTRRSIVAFEDHLSYVHRSPVHVAQGLVGSVLAAVARAPRVRRTARPRSTTAICSRSSTRRRRQHRLARHLARADGRALCVAGRS